MRRLPISWSEKNRKNIFLPNRVVLFLQRTFWRCSAGRQVFRRWLFMFFSNRWKRHWFRTAKKKKRERERGPDKKNLRKCRNRMCLISFCKFVQQHERKWDSEVTRYCLSQVQQNLKKRLIEKQFAFSNDYGTSKHRNDHPIVKTQPAFSKCSEKILMVSLDSTSLHQHSHRHGFLSIFWYKRLILARLALVTPVLT